MGRRSGLPQFGLAVRLADLIHTWKFGLTPRVPTIHCENAQEVGLKRASAIMFDYPQRHTVRKIADQVSIVLVGSFNPAIFHPIWFERYGMLPTKETDAAKVEVVTGDVALIDFPWFRLEVLRERLTVKTSDESKVSVLRDLVVSVLQLLEHTPISQIGLNREVSSEASGRTQFDAIGHNLVPKTLWSKNLSKPGTLVVGVRGVRTDDREGSINVTIKPDLSRQESVVVVVTYNDHIELKPQSTAADVATLLLNYWDESLMKSTATCDQILNDSAEGS